MKFYYIYEIRKDGIKVQLGGYFTEVEAQYHCNRLQQDSDLKDAGVLYDVRYEEQG